MNNLYNSLLSPIIEFNEKGEQIQHPPTAVMLRAARVIKQMADTNDNNVAIIQQLQFRSEELLHQVEALRKELHDLKVNSTPPASTHDASTVESDVSATDQASTSEGAEVSH